MKPSRGPNTAPAARALLRRLTPLIPAIAGLVFIWQATVVLDAGEAFGELQDAAFPGMVALAMGRTSRYFAVDAAVFWVLVGSLLVLTVAAGVS